MSDDYLHLNDSRMSKFDNKAKFGALGGIGDDHCNVKTSEYESTKPMKYYLQDFRTAPTELTRGLLWQDGFGIPRTDINSDTSLRQGKITNMNVSVSLGALPLPTLPSMLYGQGNTELEDKLRGYDYRVRKSVSPTDTTFYNRSFYIFDGLPTAPMSCTDNYVQKSNDYYMGQSSRDLNHSQKIYKKKL